MLDSSRRRVETEFRDGVPTHSVPPLVGEPMSELFDDVSRLDLESRLKNGIIKVKRRRNWFAVTNEMAQDRQLSSEALSVAVYLLSKPPDWEIRNSDLSERFDWGRNKTIQVLRELKQCGYMSHDVVRVKETGRFFHIRTLDPEKLLSPCAENRDTAPSPHLPNTVEPTPGKQGLLEVKDDKENNIQNKEESKSLLSDEEFIYSLYPRKAARPVAIRAIKNALKKESAEFLAQRTKAYAESVADKMNSPDFRFVPHPATWFNREGFYDSEAMPKESVLRNDVCPKHGKITGRNANGNCWSCYIEQPTY